MSQENATAFSLLSQIISPQDLRKLDESKLTQVAAELREFMLQGVNQTGGHFGASLGTIELAVAMHYVYDTPHDRLVWDVGHQSYGHKVLTERRHLMSTLRQADGLSSFPSRQESPYDPFGVGHSSTSISAALGMATAAAQKGEKRCVAAIIGDGAMTAGMAFEALNHAGAINANMLVILNDNDMSISENVGALSNYFARILSGKFYISLREGSKKVLNMVPPMKQLARKAELHMKGMITPGTLFEELGFNYFGPLDGHDLPVLVKTLQNLRPLSGPRLLHIVTQKGKGYAPAEADPIGYHAVAPGYLDKKTAPPSSPVPKKPTYSDIFGDWLCDMAAQDPKLIAITPAMREGSGMVKYSQQFPDRYVDVGIAEQHCVTFAAGLATEGFKPVVAIYSTFLQRAYDQLIHDVALQNLPVLFALDRAGIVGADGPTHHGCFDLNYLNCIPNMLIMAPADENECRHMLTTGFLHDGPAAVRYPRGTGPATVIDKTLTAFVIGKARRMREGSRVALLSFGALLPQALQVGEELNATVIDMRFVKPFDKELIKDLARAHPLMVTLEEGAVIGGAGSHITQYVASLGLPSVVLNLGLPDHFISHGDTQVLLQQCGLDANGIKASITQHPAFALAAHFPHVAQPVSEML